MPLFGPGARRPCVAVGIRQRDWRTERDEWLKPKIVVDSGTTGIAFVSKATICLVMKMTLTRKLAFVFTGFAAFCGPAAAQEVAATTLPSDTVLDATILSLVDRWREDPTQVFSSIDVNLEELRFIARPVVVLADSPADPLFIQQMELLLERPDELRIRDVILITDTDPAARTPVRQELRPRGFALVLIGKDGRVAQRKPAPWSVRELTRAIDKMPLRQQEIRDHAG